jgi:hypothetical protein
VTSSGRISSGATSESSPSCSTVRFSLIFLKISYWKRNLLLHTCIVGFQYARGRIQAAIYRRELGRPAATFPAIFPSFQFAQYAGGSNPSPERSTRGLPPAQADGSIYHHGNFYGVAAPNPVLSLRLPHPLTCLTTPPSPSPSHQERVCLPPSFTIMSPPWYPLPHSKHETEGTFLHNT